MLRTFVCCIIFSDVLLDSRVIFGESLFLAVSFYSRPRLFHCVFSLFSRCKEEGKEWLGIGPIHAASKVKERPLLSQRSVRGQIFRSESFAFVGSTVYVSMGKQLKKPDNFVKKIISNYACIFLTPEQGVHILLHRHFRFFDRGWGKPKVALQFTFHVQRSLLKDKGFN